MLAYEESIQNISDGKKKDHREKYGKTMLKKSYKKKYFTYIKQKIYDKEGDIRSVWNKQNSTLSISPYGRRGQTLGKSVAVRLCLLLNITFAVVQ